MFIITVVLFCLPCFETVKQAETLPFQHTARPDCLFKTTVAVKKFTEENHSHIIIAA